jgi:hypothetical protein
MDERIKVAVPTAGITSLKNHVLDGCIEGHCDCMYMVNSGGWDFDRLAALVAPRALCIANTDKDGIFPLDGVVDIYQRTRRLYRQIGAENKIGLQIAEGPHKDTQPLNTGAFHWMNRFLKGADIMDVTDEPATKRHAPADLKVFAAIPADEKVTTADDWFVPAAATPMAPKEAAEWAKQREGWMGALKEHVFTAWPQEVATREVKPATTQTAEGLRMTTQEYVAADGSAQRAWWIHRENLKPEEAEITVLNVLDETGVAEFAEMRAALFPAAGTAAKAEAFAAERKMFQNQNWVMAYVEPRGVGATSLAKLSEKKRAQILRRFHLIGETLESGQVWDIRAAAAVLPKSKALWIQAEGEMAVNAVYASLFIPGVARLDLHKMPVTQGAGPYYLNVLRHLELPQAVAMAAERSTVAIYTDKPAEWAYPRAVATALGWPEKRLQLRAEMTDTGPASR